jgi:hypothetical protein
VAGKSACRAAGRAESTIVRTYTKTETTSKGMVETVLRVALIDIVEECRAVPSYNVLRTTPIRRVYSEEFLDSISLNAGLESEQKEAKEPTNSPFYFEKTSTSTRTRR